MKNKRALILIAREAVLSTILDEFDFGHENNKKVIETLRQEIIDELINVHGFKEE
jgi:hypothetical protein